MLKESLLGLEKGIIDKFSSCSTKDGTTRNPLELVETFRSAGFVPEAKQDEESLFGLVWFSLWYRVILFVYLKRFDYSDFSQKMNFFKILKMPSHVSMITFWM